MAGRTTHLRRQHLFARRCVACGYDGGLLRDGQAPRCARCGCDLLDRPAKSYAEMEGLADPPMITLDTIDEEPQRSRAARLIERWMLFLFLALLMLFAIAALATAAVQPA